MAQVNSFSGLLQQYHRQKNFHGVALVGTDTSIDFVEAVGTGDRQKNQPFHLTSRFRIASMTKAFTAVLIMKLVEEGKLDLSKTFGEYFPEYRGEAAQKATLHHLLTYSSGIENTLESLDMAPYRKRLPLSEFIGKYCSGRIVYPPGEKSVYGNTEYIILQKIIETASGSSYGNYLRKIILEPLGMKSTGLGTKAMTGKDLVPSYTYSDSLQGFSLDDAYYVENFFAAGAMYSTAQDLFRFVSALFNNRLLKPETTQQLLTIHEKLGYSAYGIWGSPTGWGTIKERFYYRTGGILGATANWIYTADTKHTVLLLSNTNATNLYEFSEKLYGLRIQQDSLSQTGSH